MNVKKIGVFTIAYCGLSILPAICEVGMELFATPVIGAYDKERYIRKTKIRKGLEEGTIIDIGGRYYEKYVVE